MKYNEAWLNAIRAVDLNFQQPMVIWNNVTSDPRYRTTGGMTPILDANGVPHIALGAWQVNPQFFGGELGYIDRETPNPWLIGQGNEQLSAQNILWANPADIYWNPAIGYYSNNIQPPGKSGGFFSGELGALLLVGASLAIGAGAFALLSEIGSVGASSIAFEAGALDFVTPELVNEAIASGVLTAEQGSVALAAAVEQAEAIAAVSSITAADVVSVIETAPVDVPVDIPVDVPVNAPIETAITQGEQAAQVIGDLSGEGASEFVTQEMVKDAVLDGTLTIEQGAQTLTSISNISITDAIKTLKNVVELQEKITDAALRNNSELWNRVAQGDLTGEGASEFVTPEMVRNAVADGTLTQAQGASILQDIAGPVTNSAYENLIKQQAATSSGAEAAKALASTVIKAAGGTVASALFKILTGATSHNVIPGLTGTLPINGVVPPGYVIDPNTGLLRPSGDTSNIGILLAGVALFALLKG